jgi:hypothetical protein
MAEKTEKLSAKFCRCINQVSRTVKARSKKARESAAIGICVKSVLQTRGRTIKKFSCRRKTLITQPIKKAKS